MSSPSSVSNDSFDDEQHEVGFSSAESTPGYVAELQTSETDNETEASSDNETGCNGNGISHDNSSSNNNDVPTTSGYNEHVYYHDMLNNRPINPNQYVPPLHYFGQTRDNNTMVQLISNRIEELEDLRRNFEQRVLDDATREPLFRMEWPEFEFNRPTWAFPIVIRCCNTPIDFIDDQADTLTEIRKNLLGADYWKMYGMDGRRLQNDDELNEQMPSTSAACRARLAKRTGEALIENSPEKKQKLSNDSDDDDDFE